MNSNEQYKWDVFVSYSSEDASWVRGWLWTALTGAGLVVNIDDKSFDVGVPIVKNIAEAVERSRKTVVVLTPAWKASSWTEFEAFVTHSQDPSGRQRRILTVLKEKCELPSYLKPFCYIDFTNRDRWRESLERLVNAIQDRSAFDIQSSPPKAKLHDWRSHGRIALAIVLALLLLLFVRTDVLPSYFPENTNDLDVLLRGRAWVGYDPSRFDPVWNPNPSPESIEHDLASIRAAGFGGVVTFASRGPLATIPRIAKVHGLRVIMGIWNAADETELNAAIREKLYADAYAIGHNQLGIRYSMPQLQEAITNVRSKTRKPVATSEQAEMYGKNRSLLGAGDWLFPDVHVVFIEGVRKDLKTNTGEVMTVTTGVTLRESLIVSRQFASELASLAAEVHRPLMLKMALFPWAGAPGASLETQQAFFADFAEWCQSPHSGLPIKVSLVVHSAFDSPWKRSRPFYRWDPYTGLFDPTGMPRPAVAEVVQRFRTEAP